MPVKKPSRKKSFHATPRYWYHISTTLKGKSLLLKPYGNIENAFNRSQSEPDVPRICVAPSIAHCLTAVPYSPGDDFTIYRTKNKVKAKKAIEVFDADITLEGWIQKPTIFIKIGELRLDDVEIGEKIDHVIEEAAASGEKRESKQVFRWWNKKNIWKYVKRT